MCGVIFVECTAVFVTRLWSFLDCHMKVCERFALECTISTVRCDFFEDVCNLWHSIFVRMTATCLTRSLSDCKINVFKHRHFSRTISCAVCLSTEFNLFQTIVWISAKGKQISAEAYAALRNCATVEMVWMKDHGFLKGMFVHDCRPCFSAWLMVKDFSATVTYLCSLKCQQSTTDSRAWFFSADRPIGSVPLARQLYLSVQHVPLVEYWEESMTNE